MAGSWWSSLTKLIVGISPYRCCFLLIVHEPLLLLILFIHHQPSSILSITVCTFAKSALFAGYFLVFKHLQRWCWKRRLKRKLAKTFERTGCQGQRNGTKRCCNPCQSSSSLIVRGSVSFLIFADESASTQKWYHKYREWLHNTGPSSHQAEVLRDRRLGYANHCSVSLETSTEHLSTCEWRKRVVTFTCYSDLFSQGRVVLSWYSETIC